MPVIKGESEHYKIPYLKAGSELSETEVFEPAARLADDELYKRELDLKQLSRDLYSSPSLDQDGNQNLDVPLQAAYLSLQDALFTQVTAFADALPSPANIEVVESGSGADPTITKYWAVVAEDATRRSEVSAEDSLTYQTGKVPVLTFTPASGATKHYIYRGDSSGVYREGITVTMPLNVPATPTATPSASGGSLATATYYYKVTAIDANGVETPGGAEASATVTGPTGSVALSWTAVTGASSYLIYRGTASGAQDVYYTSITNSYTDTGAVSTAGSPSSYARLVGGTYGAVSAPVLSAIGSLSSATLKVKTTVGLTVDQYVRIVDTYSFLRPTLTSVVASGSGSSLAAGTHSYRVTSYNAYRESEASPKTSVVLTAGQNAVVSWQPVKDAQQYRVYRTNPDGSEHRVITGAGTLANGILSYTDTGTSEAAGSPQVAYYKLTGRITAVDSVNKTITINESVPTELYRNYTQIAAKTPDITATPSWIRALSTADVAPTDGKAVEIVYQSGADLGLIQSIDRDAAPDTFKPLEIVGSTITLKTGTTAATSAISIASDQKITLVGAATFNGGATVTAGNVTVKATIANAGDLILNNGASPDEGGEIQFAGWGTTYTAAIYLDRAQNLIRLHSGGNVLWSVDTGGAMVAKGTVTLETNNTFYRARAKSGMLRDVLGIDNGASSAEGLLQIGNANVISNFRGFSHTFASAVTIASGQTLTLTGATVSGQPTWSSVQTFPGVISSDDIKSTVDNNYLKITGANTGGQSGASIQLYGKSHATTPSRFEVRTPRNDFAADIVRMYITGGVAEGSGSIVLSEPLTAVTATFSGAIFAATGSVFSSGTNASTNLSVGSGGAAPTANRGIDLILDSPHSATFVGAAAVSHRRAGTQIWGVGINTAGATGPKSSDTDYYWHGGGSYRMALTTAGVLTVSGGVTVQSGGTLTLTGATVTGAPTWSAAQMFPGLTSTEDLKVSANKGIVIGHSALLTFTLTPRLQVMGQDNNQAAAQIARFSNDGSGSLLEFAKSRSISVGGNTIVANGDSLGIITARGANGTGYTPAAQISFLVDGTPGAINDMPGSIVLYTTPDGSGSLAEAMRIGNGRNVTIAAPSSGVGLTVLGGGIAVTGNSTFANALSVTGATTLTSTIEHRRNLNSFTNLWTDAGTSNALRWGIKLMTTTADFRINRWTGAVGAEVESQVMQISNATGAVTIASAVTVNATGSVFSAGTDASTQVSIGAGGSAPTATRSAILQLNAPHSATFKGKSSVIFSRASADEWDFGLDTFTGGAKSSNTDLYWYGGGSYRMSVSTAGQLRLYGGGGVLPALEAGIIVLAQNNGATTDPAIFQLIAGNAGNAKLLFGDTDDSNAGGIIYEHSTNNMVFRVADVERMTIDGNGDVGIGAASDGSPLYVWRASGAENTWIKAHHAQGDGTTYAGLQMSTGNSVTVHQIASRGGSLHLGTTGTYNLITLNASGKTSFYSHAEVGSYAATSSTRLAIRFMATNTATQAGYLGTYLLTIGYRNTSTSININNGHAVAMVTISKSYNGNYLFTVTQLVDAGLATLSTQVPTNTTTNLEAKVYISAAEAVQGFEGGVYTVHRLSGDILGSVAIDTSAAPA